MLHAEPLVCLVLEPADQELLSREVTLPAMRVVLDPDRATSAIDRAWPRLGLRGLAITSARYEAGKSCLVAYMLETPDGRQPAYIKVTADPAPCVDVSDVCRCSVKTSELTAQ